MLKLNLLVFAYVYIGNVLCTSDENNPTMLFVKQGGEALLMCSFEATGLIWQKYNIIIANKNVTTNATKYIVTQNPSSGHYVGLRILNVETSDEAKYKCQDGVNSPFHFQLVLVVPLSSVSIENVTPQDLLLGTEGEDFTVSCEAVGGKPPPVVALMVKETTFSIGNQSATWTIQSISRSYDRKNVTCLATNEAYINNSQSDFARFYLKLKPLQPTFSLYPVSTEETKPLVVSCTSTGSRPAATFQWTIGLATITSGITTTTVYNTADETYTVTSTMTHTADRTYNRQTLTCGAYNNVSTSGIVANTTLDVKFAPDITVNNETYNQDAASRLVTCITVGNPTTYTYFRWQHKSTYGVLIRELDGGQNGVLALPSVPVDARYQDSGEYVCTASNGVTGRNGNIQQTGSGYVTVNAQSKFTNDNNNTKYGEFGKDVDIHVYVYSVPKYTFLKWYKTNTEITKMANKYDIFELEAIVHDTFNGTYVQLDGYRLTLTIKNLVALDFNVSYRVEVFNSFGQHVIYSTLLVSASAPETPVNFTVVNPSESSIVVQWEAGYNGGQEQTFYVEYRKFRPDTWAAVKIPDTKQTGRQNYTLKGLHDGTLYELRMYAENQFNKSFPTETKTIETMKDSQVSASIQIGPIIGGVAGGLAALLFTLVIAWFVIFKRKQDTSATSKASRSTSDSEIPDGLQHNILYQSAGSDFKPLVPKAVTGKKPQKPSSSDTEYAEVQKPNAVYAAVDKTVPQKNVQDKKQKDKKIPKKPGKKTEKAGNNNQDNEYANAGISLKDMGEGKYANPEDKSGPSTSHKNQQGLEYADLSFTKQIPQKSKKPVIHGEEDRTLYSEVDHSKKAPPPPQESAYEETNFKHG